MPVPETPVSQTGPLSVDLLSSFVSHTGQDPEWGHAVFVELDEIVRTACWGLRPVLEGS